MSRTFSIRLPKDLADWLAKSAAATGVSQGKLIKDVLERARAAGEKRRYLRLVGCVRGLPADLSSRRGFSRK